MGSVTVRLLWPLGIDERKDKWGVRTFPCRPCARAFPRRQQPLTARSHWSSCCKLLHVESLVCLTAMEETRGPKVNFFFLNFWFVTNTSAAMEHFKLVFGSGNNSPAKIRPLKVWTSWISPWPFGSALWDFASAFLFLCSNIKRQMANGGV